MNEHTLNPDGIPIVTQWLSHDTGDDRLPKGFWTPEENAAAMAARAADDERDDLRRQLAAAIRERNEAWAACDACAAQATGVSGLNDWAKAAAKGRYRTAIIKLLGNRNPVIVELEETDGVVVTFRCRVTAETIEEAAAKALEQAKEKKA